MEQGSASNSGQRLEVIVAGDEGSVRLDRVLAVRLPQLSRSRLKALILADAVTLKNAPVRDPAYHVSAGDTITIDVPEAVAAEPAGEDIALDIVHEDDDIIVINKPRGLVVHPGRRPRDRHPGQRPDRPLRRPAFPASAASSARASCTGSTRTPPG